MDDFPFIKPAVNIVSSETGAPNSDARCKLLIDPRAGLFVLLMLAVLLSACTEGSPATPTMPASATRSLTSQVGPIGASTATNAVTSTPSPTSSVQLMLAGTETTETTSRPGPADPTIAVHVKLPAATATAPPTPMARSKPPIPPALAPSVGGAGKAPAPTADATPLTSSQVPSNIHYVFPVQPVASTIYGAYHHDYPATDIFCPIGSHFVAPTSGVVDYVTIVDRWDPATDDPAVRGGLSVAIIGDDGVRYYGSHLSGVADGIVPGVRVTAGQLLGLTGKTGDARFTDAHLHFGISPPTTPDDWKVRRGTISPYKYLRAWAVGTQIRPVLK